MPSSQFRGFLVLASGTLSLLLLANECQAVLIDFDNLPGGGTTTHGQTLTDEYASLGVRFRGFEDDILVENTVGNDDTLTNPQGLALSNTNPFVNLGGVRHDVLQILFDEPVMDLHWLTRLSFSAPTFEFYDQVGQLLGTLPGATGACCSLVETDASAFEGVARIDAIQPSDSWFWAMDNLSFARVPEPTCWALLMLGACSATLVRPL